MLPQHLQNAAAESSLATADSFLLDHLAFMRSQETSRYQVTEDYLLHPYAAVTEIDRRTMVAWSHDIVDACSISREISCIATSYFDRFMCTTTTRAQACLLSRREFQLAFISCLIVALKCRAGMQVDSDFVSGTICQGLYNEAEIVEMEKEVLSALQWRLNGPSAHEFVGGFLELLPGMTRGSKVAEQLKASACKQAESAALDYAMAARAPSSIAYAALLASLHSLGGDAFPLLDRYAWIKNIGLVTGVEAACSTASAAVLAPRTPHRMFERRPTTESISSASSYEDGYRNVVCQSPTHMSPGYGYCSPASSAPSSPYNDMSPVCAMLDGRLDIR